MTWNSPERVDPPSLLQTLVERISEILTSKDVDDDGASCNAASARVVHVESSSGSRIWICRCSASNQLNNLATAQVRKDTPSLIDVKGLGRPKDFTGREEDFQLWSKKTVAFSAGVIKESEMMLEWAAEKRLKSRRQQLISSSCRRTRTRTEERKT